METIEIDTNKEPAIMTPEEVALFLRKSVSWVHKFYRKGHPRPRKKPVEKKEPSESQGQESVTDRLLREADEEIEP